MLIEQIKEQQLAARKAKNTERASLLTTLYSEASIVGFNDGKRLSTDEEVQKTIQKFIKNIDECIAKCPDKKDQYEKERAILEEFLPTQITGKELEALLMEVISQVGDKKADVMKYLKQHYQGQYNGKEVSQLLER